MKKSIILIIPNLDFGGAQTAFSKLSVSLNEHYNVHCVVFNSKKMAAYKLGGVLISLDVPGSNNILSKAVNFFRRVKKLRRLKKKLKTNVSISFLEGADYVNILSRVNEKVIISIRGSKVNDKEIRGYLGWLRLKLFLPLIYNRASWIVAVSEGLAMELTHQFNFDKGKIRVIENYYDTESIILASRQAVPEFFERLFMQYACIVSIGRLHQQKNFSALINAFKIAREENDRIKLVLVGNGPLLEELLETCKRLKLRVVSFNNPTWNEEADVFIVDYQQNPWAYISRSNLFILSSSWEGFPNALAEAMILGKPVISTDCPYGPREIITKNDVTTPVELNDAEWHNAGVLVPVLSTYASMLVLANTINLIVSDNILQTKMGQAAFEKVSQFTPQKALKLWLDTIEN